MFTLLQLHTLPYPAEQPQTHLVPFWGYSEKTYWSAAVRFIQEILAHGKRQLNALLVKV